MVPAFDVGTLVSFYDRGELAPFIGSGMSRRTCRDWHGFVESLESRANVPHDATWRDPIERAFFALQVLRRKPIDIKVAVAKALYEPGSRKIPEQTTVLASLPWPLVCTTNYDDLYCLARFRQCRRKVAPLVLGRSEEDCRRVLQHISFPTTELVWALQGFLQSKEARLAQIVARDNPRVDDLEEELVVGHAEYRRAAHRSPHFRRCFAHVFQARAFLFLGSGLAEPYFRSLFDEIIELTGPPSHPHFALVEEESLDPDFMKSEYHILCNTYPKGQHQDVIDQLKELVDAVQRPRPRQCSMNFRVAFNDYGESQDARPDFAVVHAALPQFSDLRKGEVVAISCGRAKSTSGDSDERGKPLPSELGATAIGLSKVKDYGWLNEWTVEFHEDERLFGIVAREPVTSGVVPRDRRSPEAIYSSLYGFLDEMQARGIRVAHVQLLSAGKQRVFEPWIALTQMARAYGQWWRDSVETEETTRVRLLVYVVEPSVIGLLSAGCLDLAAQLAGTQVRIWLEIVDANGQVARHYEMVGQRDTLRDVAKFARLQEDPLLHARPLPHRQAKSRRLSNVETVTVSEFGLVAGSTLVIDYRGDGD